MQPALSDRSRDRKEAAGILAIAFLAAPLLAQPQQNFDNVQIRVFPIQGNVYMLAGAGGNITLQVGKDGVLMVDTEFAPLAPKIMAEIRKLSPGPIRYIINTHVHPDHVGGNDAFAKLIPQTPGAPLKIIAHENVLNRMTKPADYVPSHLPGTNPYLHEVADWYGLPYEATRGGAETLYPEYRSKMGKPEKSPEKCERYCTCGQNGGPCNLH